MYCGAKVSWTTKTRCPSDSPHRRGRLRRRNTRADTSSSGKAPCECGSCSVLQTEESSFGVESGPCQLPASLFRAGPPREDEEVLRVDLLVPAPALPSPCSRPSPEVPSYGAPSVLRYMDLWYHDFSTIEAGSPPAYDGVGSRPRIRGTLPCAMNVPGKASACRERCHALDRHVTGGGNHQAMWGLLHARGRGLAAAGASCCAVA